MLGNRERDAAVVLAHHATKGENGGYRDSTAIGAAVDLILELQRDGDGPRRKVSALGRWAVAGFTLELVGDGYRLVAVGELSLDARLLAFVQQHPACSKLDVRSSVGAQGVMQVTPQTWSYVEMVLLGRKIRHGVDGNIHVGDHGPRVSLRAMYGMGSRNLPNETHRLQDGVQDGNLRHLPDRMRSAFFL